MKSISLKLYHKIEQVSFDEESGHGNLVFFIDNKRPITLSFIGYVSVQAYQD